MRSGSFKHARWVEHGHYGEKTEKLIAFSINATISSARIIDCSGHSTLRGSRPRGRIDSAEWRSVYAIFSKYNFIIY